MRMQPSQKMIGAIALCFISVQSASVIAAPDEFQRQMTQRIQQAKQKLQQAKVAKGAERQKLVEEHMKMMKSNMGEMQAMKPKTGMSMQEHEEWINQHQNLMEDMMGQMMEEHHLLLDMKCD